MTRDEPTQPVGTPHSPAWLTAPVEFGTATYGSPSSGSTGSGAPPQPPRRSRARVWTALAIGLALVSAAAGAGFEVALRHGASTTSNPSRFVAPTLPFDDGSSSGGSTSTNGLDVSSIAKRVDPAIVNIAVDLADGGEAAGTGMVITSSGEVLTNNHVINGATRIRVEIGVTGETHTATVVGYDVADDVALLQIRGASNMKTIDVGDSSGVRVDDAVVAIGNALARFGTPTAVPGVVTGVHRTITAGDTASDTETLTDMIQVQAAIQPGDSGGPLVDANAKVIGMDTAADAGSGRFRFRSGNAGFAIPIDRAMSIADQIESGRASDRVHIGGSRALLGVHLGVSGDNGESEGFGADNTAGATVVQVESDSAADGAGLQAGDMIVSIDGTIIGSSAELATVLGRSSPGDRVEVGWLDSSGHEHHATVQLGSGPPA